MPDEPKRMLPRMPRLQTATDRDLSGIAARKERESVPVECEEDVTGRYEGDELRSMRSRRSSEERISRLEGKHDGLAATVGETRIDVAQLKVESDEHGKKLDKIDQKLDLIVAGRVEFGRRIWLTLIGSGGIALWLLQHYLGGR